MHGDPVFDGNVSAKAGGADSVEVLDLLPTRRQNAADTSKRVLPP